MSTGYLKDGRVVEVHSEVDGGFIVEHYEHYQNWEGEYEDMLSGNKVVVSEVLKTPPEQTFCDSINNANKQLLELNSEINNKRSELYDINEEVKDVVDRSKSIPVIKNILEFIDGKYKYFAFPESYSEDEMIRDAHTSLDDDHDKYNRNTKLLTLEGDSKGNLQWNISKYRDGSGGDTLCIPCLTIEDARDAVAEHLTAQLYKMEASHNANYWRVETCCNWLVSNKYPCPEKFILIAKERTEKKKADSIVSAKKALKVAEDNLAKAMQ